MSSLPPPLDNTLVLIAVILGIIVLGFGISQNRAASRRLDAVRKEKARIIREAKLAAKDHKD